jgi:hypothetical protein
MLNLSFLLVTKIKAGQLYPAIPDTLISRAELYYKREKYYEALDMQELAIQDFRFVMLLANNEQLILNAENELRRLGADP